MKRDAYMHWGNTAAAALLFGAMLSGIGLWNVIRAAATSSWPSVAGTIEDSRVKYMGRSGPDEPDVRYTYVVAGRRYTGTRIGYSLLVSDGSTRRLVSRYARGSTVPVFHDPRQPARAVLQRGGAMREAFILLAGIGMLAFWQYARGRTR